MRSQRLLTLGLAASLSGCHLLQPGTPRLPVSPVADRSATVADSKLPATAVSGRAEFSAIRSTQAQTGDVVTGATVSFIDNTGTTVATGKTDGAGSFTLVLGSFVPVTGSTYLLEAVKGLGNQAPGAHAVRIRTILQWNGSSWLSCTNNTAGGAIVLNLQSTALAIESALDPSNVPPAQTIGKVNVSVSPAVFNPTPGPYSTHPDSELAQLASDLASSLGSDQDPVATVPAIKPTITSFQPAAGPINGLIQINGSGFNPVASGNTVKINGTPAQVVLATPTQLVAVVASGTTNGALSVATARGSVTGGTFSVTGSGGSGGSGSSAPLAWIDAFSPTFGQVESTVSISGNFGSPSSTPSVQFAGPGGTRVDAPVSAYSGGSITATVPIGSLPGPITVTTGGVTTTAASTFDVWQGDLANFTLLDNPNLQTGEFCYNINHLVQPVRWKGYMYHWNGALQMLPVYRDGSIGMLRNVGSLPNFAYMTHVALAVIGNWIYVIGGYDGFGTNRTIWCAPLYDDGNVGTFRQVGSLAYGRYHHRALSYGNAIYVFPGYNTMTVERLNVDPSNGSIISSVLYSPDFWGYSGNSYGMYGYYLNQSSSTWIISGGYGSWGYTNHLSVGWFNTDGSPSNASNNGSYAAPSTQYFGSAIWNANGYGSGQTDLYLLGGHNGTTWNNAGAWRVGYYNGSNYFYDSTTMVSAPNTLSYASPFQNLDQIYVPGSYDGAYCDNWLTTTIRGDRSLSPWAKMYTGNTGYAGGGALIGDKLYTLGGWSQPWNTPNGAAVATSRLITANPGGSLSGASTGPDLNQARAYSSVVVANGYVYVIGGYDNGTCFNSIEKAQIRPDNTLGNFMTVPQSLAMARYNCASFAYGGYLYVLGGWNNIKGLPANTVERFVLNSDGTLGAGSVLPVQIPNGTGYNATQGTVMIGNRVYLAGAYAWTPAAHGMSGSMLQTLSRPTGEIFTTTVNPDGSLAPITRSNGVLPWPVHQTVMRRIGNYLYVFGGGNQYTPTNIIQRAFIKADGTLGEWSIYKLGGQDPMETTFPNGSGFLVGNNFYLSNIMTLASSSTAVKKGYAWTTVH